MIAFVTSVVPCTMPADLADRDAVRLERLLQDRLDRAGGLVRRRQRLADGDEPVLAHDAEVGERAADIDTDAQASIGQASRPTFGYWSRPNISICGGRCWKRTPPST